MGPGASLNYLSFSKAADNVRPFRLPPTQPGGTPDAKTIPNLRCTKWQAFRGKIVGVPSYPACRSQMEIEIDGDWRRLLREMEGFHTQVVYGDYTREIDYALRKLGGQIQWDCFS